MRYSILLSPFVYLAPPNMEAARHKKQTRYSILLSPFVYLAPPNMEAARHKKQTRLFYSALAFCIFAFDMRSGSVTLTFSNTIWSVIYK